MSAVSFSIYPVTHRNGYVQDYGPLRLIREMTDLSEAEEHALRHVIADMAPAPQTTFQEGEETSRRAALAEVLYLIQVVMQKSKQRVDDGYAPEELLPLVRKIIGVAISLESQLTRESELRLLPSQPES